MNFFVRPKKKAAPKTHEAVIDTPQGRVTIKAKRNRRARRMTLRMVRRSRPSSAADAMGAAIESCIVPPGCGV